MHHVLLLGAGFSRNWGGWLAIETFEYLLGTPEVQRDSDLRRLLWAHQRKGGFEDALAELRQLAARDPQGPPSASLAGLHAAVVRMFADMNKGLTENEWEFVGEVSMEVGRLLAKFDVIFTLNQDILLEHRYVPNLMHYAHPRFHSATLPGMARIPSDDPMHTNSWAWSKWVPGGDFQVGSNSQPIYKLHGSSNWFERDGGPLLIIGGEKTSDIAGNRVLSRYAEEFERHLRMDTRLMVIGYGFRDEHINSTMERAADRGLQMFVIDPRGGGLADSLNKTRQANQKIGPSSLENLFERTLIGASRRSLRETFGLDSAEHAKVMRFFDN